MSGAGEPNMNMQKAITYVTRQLSNKLTMITKYVIFIKDSEELFRQYELILASIYKSSLNPAT